MHAVHRCGLLLQMQRGLCVDCLLVKTISCAKMAEPIEMPFGMWTRVGQRNHGLGGGSVFFRKRAILGGHIPAHCKV